MENSEAERVLTNGVIRFAMMTNVAGKNPFPVDNLCRVQENTEEYPMSKYYVQCGSLELVISRETAECAAIAAIDRFMAPHLWIYEDELLCDSDRLRHLMLEALLHLPSEICVSEQGFNRPDCIRISVPETVETWHAMIVAFNRLFFLARVVPGATSHSDNGDVTVDRKNRLSR